MDLNWVESLLYGFFSGLAEILPVSAHAHRLVLLKVFGTEKVPGLMLLMIHLSVLGALYFCCQTQLLRMSRAVRLSRIPRKRRKRPLDAIGLMDFKLWLTMAVPLVIAFFFYGRSSALENNSLAVGIFLLLNGIILYIPQYLPGSNRDSRTLSRVDGLLVGLGAGLSVLPGMSCMGCALSVSSIRGFERKYALNMALLLEMAATVCLVVTDVMGIAANGLGILFLGSVLGCLAAAAAAFCATLLAVQILRRMVEEPGITPFAYYCWGLALFAFIMTLFV